MFNSQYEKIGIAKKCMYISVSMCDLNKTVMHTYELKSETSRNIHLDYI